MKFLHPKMLACHPCLSKQDMWCLEIFAWTQSQGALQFPWTPHRHPSLMGMDWVACCQSFWSKPCPPLAHVKRAGAQKSCECWIKRPAYLMKQFSLLEIISPAVLLANVVVVVVDLLESSMLLTQLHFKLPTGAPMPLFSCTSNTLRRRCGSLGDSNLHTRC